MASKSSRKLRTQYECDKCGKEFTKSDNLKRHMRIHSGERPFKCTTCGQQFTQSQHLTAHLRTHTGEKPFKCDICGKEFTESGSLKKHLRIHTGERPFKCETCRKKFTLKGDLTKHLRTHTGEKPYKCDNCGKGFTVSSSLKTHLRSMHKAGGEPKRLLAKPSSSTRSRRLRSCSESDEEDDQTESTDSDDSEQYINNSDNSIDDDDDLSHDHSLAGAWGIDDVKNEVQEGHHEQQQEAPKQHVGTEKAALPTKNKEAPPPKQNANANDGEQLTPLVESPPNMTYGDITADGAYLWSFASRCSPTNVMKLQAKLDSMIAEKRELERKLKLQSERMRRENAEKVGLDDQNRLQADLANTRAELTKAVQKAVEVGEKSEKE